jgi:5-dehydro-2-deoxygluconokinase
MAGFLRGWLRDEPLERSCAYANACGALVVSRHGCAPAIPSWPELQHFLARGSATRRLREDPALEHLHRATTRARGWSDLAVLAFDHRAQLEALAEETGRGPDDIRAFKRLVAEGAARGAPPQGAGVIVDGRYGEDVLPRFTGQGWWVARPVERPGARPLAFDNGPDLTGELRTWPREQVAKCLVLHHPGDVPALRDAQFAALAHLQAACHRTGHELLLEVLAPRDVPGREPSSADALEQIYAAGVRPDWWKLPPQRDADGWRAVAEVIARHDPHCRGVLLLGLDAPQADLVAAFDAAAAHPVVKGFAVGRSIFGEPAREWFSRRIEDAAVVERVAARYSALVTAWRRARSGAMPVST